MRRALPSLRRRRSPCGCSERRLDRALRRRRAAWRRRAEKNLMPLSSIRVVRGADHDARGQAQRAREVGDAGRRQRAAQQHVDAGRGEARPRAPTRACSPRCACPCRSAPSGARRRWLAARVPTAWPRRSTKSGVIGAWPDRAADAVGAEVFSCSWSCSCRAAIVRRRHRAPHRQRIDRCRARRARARCARRAATAEQRRRHAGAPAARRPRGR